MLLDNLKNGLSTYLSIAEATSTLLINQSIAVNAISSQIVSLNSIVETSILSLDAGFEKLHHTLRETENHILSWAGKRSGWMVSSSAGFIIGTLAGVNRWIVIGTSIQN